MVSYQSFQPSLRRLVQALRGRFHLGTLSREPPPTIHSILPTSTIRLSKHTHARIDPSISHLLVL